MPAPLTVTRNDYRENEKKSDIQTPVWVAENILNLFEGWLGEKVKQKPVLRILEPCIGDGNLVAPWKAKLGKSVSVESYEIKEGKDFLQVERLDVIPDIVLCNPPFNQGCGKRLMPMVFLEQILKLIHYDSTIPIVLFTPHGLRLNLRSRLKNKSGWSARAKRLVELEDQNICITSIGSMPLDAFDEVLFHCEILIWNAPQVKPHFICYPEHPEKGEL